MKKKREKTVVTSSKIIKLKQTPLGLFKCPKCAMECTKKVVESVGYCVRCKCELSEGKH